MTLNLSFAVALMSFILLTAKCRTITDLTIMVSKKRKKRFNSLELAGEFVVILGPSGAGKSTVLNLLGGMDTVTSGKIIVNGKDISGLSDLLLAYRAGLCLSR